MKNYLYFLLCFVTAISISCSDEDDDITIRSGDETVPLPEAQSVITDNDGNTYEVGFNQVTSINQNPFVRKRSSSGNTLWNITHESTPVDGKAEFVFLDNDQNPWVVFSFDGGSNEGGYINRKEIEDNAFSGVFQNNYGSGGGPRVSVLARLNPDTGKIVKGSFITARLTNGNTNTLRIIKADEVDGIIAFEINSAAWPPGTGTSYNRFPDLTDEDRVDGAFKIYYEINTGLSEITKAVLLKI